MTLLQSPYIPPLTPQPPRQSDEERRWKGMDEEKRREIVADFLQDESLVIEDAMVGGGPEAAGWEIRRAWDGYRRKAMR